METLLRHQVTLVEQQHVAVDDLGPGHVALEQLVAEVLGINQGDDRIEPGGIAQVAAQKCHRNGQGIGQTCGFDHQVIDRFGALQNSVDGLEQFAVDRATDAAVAQLHHVVAGGHDEVVVDTDLAKFVDQHSRFEALLIVENVVEQGGFACPQKAGQDGHRHGGTGGGIGARGRGVERGGAGCHRGARAAAAAVGETGFSLEAPLRPSLPGLKRHSEVKLGFDQGSQLIEIGAGRGFGPQWPPEIEQRRRHADPIGDLDLGPPFPHPVGVVAI